MTNRSKTALKNLDLAKMDPRDQIAPNFRYYELTRSELAGRRGIDNSFSSDLEMRAAVYLARNVLQLIRNEFGSFSPNSVFRSQALERCLKRRPASWISTSMHTRGGACDVEIVGVSTMNLAEWSANNLPDYDQIICECYDPTKGSNSGWVHIALKPPELELGANRRKLLSYIRDAGSGRMVYVQGLRESVA